MNLWQAMVLPERRSELPHTSIPGGQWADQWGGLGVRRLWVPNADTTPRLPAWATDLPKEVEVRLFDGCPPTQEEPIWVVEPSAAPLCVWDGLPDWHRACKADVTAAMLRTSALESRSSWTVAADGKLSARGEHSQALFVPAGVYLCSPAGAHRIWAAWQTHDRVPLEKLSHTVGLPVPPTATRRLDIGDGWTLFLDRDGVINERIIGGYVRSPEAFRLLPGVLEVLPGLRAQFDRILVVTNQQGIGKGLMSVADLRKVHDVMARAFRAVGVHLDGIYACPGLVQDDPVCRKPLPGMALQALSDFPDIDLTRSVMIGDSDSDIEFGRRLGMYTVKVGERSQQADRWLASLAEWVPIR
jgi:D-glycero-D-manno-heptose 1,7-bisphosphate phosphatase